MHSIDLPGLTIADIPATTYGTSLVAPGLTCFRLWAPNAQRVDVVINGGAAVEPMRQLANGWFEAYVKCGAGTPYLFRLDGDLEVPDPASRAQQSDAHGPSLVMDPNSYQWRDAHWSGRRWEETVFYEMHVGACGGFAGVLDMLPSLARLGITAIELMPIAAFPGNRNWGYDGVLQFAPEASYGTPDQLKALIDTAHALDMQVFLDVVYNHFGPDGNYLNTYARTFFRDDLSTPWGAAIDFRRPEVKEFFVQNALYWINEFHIDGLRMDALHAIKEQEWLPELAADIRARIRPGRHVHLVMEHEDNAAHLMPSSFNAQWNDDGHHALHVLLTGETSGYYTDYAEDTAAKLCRCLEQGFIYQGEPSPHRMGTPRGTPSGHLPPSSFVLFLQNHDQIGNRAFGERLTTLARPAALRAAMALLLLSPQIPLLFMGEPVGATEPFRYFTDYKDEALAQAVREGRRSEFAAFAEFEDPERRAAIPDPNDAGTFEASIPTTVSDGDLSANRRRWLAWTRSLLAARHAHVIPRLAGCTADRARVLGSHAVEARWRLGDGSLLMIAVNLLDSPVPYRPDTGPGEEHLLFETPGALFGLREGVLPGDGLIALMMPPEAPQA
ncbi:malto-oligosyltrehalose trehalohydrolase [Noviherbaspirillum suwonense]|uniref:Malto-oligosyltrehalose trehalohydrolase n=1 Tax=Noviherbaspirillum suwonense TaxID=1224511 RepID=A0ABY1QLB6_9BURK|nr:malto-oligosyltrehalose trehalohydrolase [Noviherbaspirillum suwonense]SMP74293.1 maltooligosyl trehalose hydrolase [Noviherbaspirillum suwonense]